MRTIVGRAATAAALAISGLTLALAAPPSPASAAAPAVDQFTNLNFYVSTENGTQTEVPNHIVVSAVIRHDAGTTVNGVRFDLVHSSSGGTYGSTNCSTTASITCSGGYVGDGGWNNQSGRGTTTKLTVRELPGQAAVGTSTNSNYSQVIVEIVPPNYDSWQNDGPDGSNNGICGIEGDNTHRACKNTMAFSFRLSDNQTTSDQTAQYWTASESNSSGNEDLPVPYASTSTGVSSSRVVPATVTAGTNGAVTINYTCDDNDSGSPADCDSAKVRYRRLGDNAIVNPGASSDSSGNLTCSLAVTSPGCETRTGTTPSVIGNFNADDNSARTYTYRAPRSRGLYVIEANFCNETGPCPSSPYAGLDDSTTFNGVAGGSAWNLLGAFYVNDAAPTVSFGTATQTGGSNVGVHPTTNALHPNTGTTVTYNLTTSADTQVIDWNLDQNNTNGINSSGYETRTYGTVSYSSSAGTPTVTKSATQNLSAYGSGVSCAAGARVYDTGGINATDPSVLSATATQACTTNNLPAGTAQSSVNVQRGASTAINLAASDADRWSAGGNGGDEAPTITITQPAVGSVSCGSFTPATTTTGSFACSYTVPANTTPGAYSYSYTVTDSHNGTSTAATVSGTILNTAPTATGSTRTIQRGKSATFNLNGGDPTNSDTIDGSISGTGYATVSTASMPAGSSTSCTAAGACTVSIAANTTPGNYSFTWNVKDNANTSSTATETITVANTAPVADAITVNDVQRGRPASEKAFNLSASDVNGDTLTYTVVSTAGLPAGSSLTCSGTGACTVGVPANTAVTNYSFTYKANDGVVDSNTATATVGVGNTTPVANPVGPLHTTVGSPLSVTLDGTDFNGDTLTYAAPVSGPSKGNVTGSGASRTYTASNGTKGNDSFTYTAADNAPSTSTAGTVSIVIDNTAPTASTQSVMAHRGIAKAITLAGADVNADALTFAIDTNVTKGVLSCDAAGSCTYTAGPGQTGTDSFTFVANDGTANSAPATVTITIANDAPTATAASVDAPRRVSTGFTLQGTDPNGDPLTYTAPVSGPSKGTVSCTASGGCTYTSGPGQTGSDSFTFTASDGYGGSDTAAVTIDLTNTAPVAQSQTLDAPRRVATDFSVHATDANEDAVAYAVSTPPTKGSISCDTSGACTYRSDPGQTGTDSFTFAADDGHGGTDLGTVDISLTNTDPVANGQAVDVPRRVPTAITLTGSDANEDVLAYDAPTSGPSKGSLSCTNAVCTYTSDPGQTGTDSFTYSVDDGFGGTDTATVDITLTNSDPQAIPQGTTADVHVATPITLHANDANQDALFFSVDTPPSKGSVTCDSAGACSYQSNLGATGMDQFTFAVDDGFGGTDTAVVDIDLSNTRPIAEPQSVAAPRQVATPITLSGTDPNGDPLTYTGPITGPSKGNLSCTGSSCTYTSNPGETGTDSFTFGVQDPGGLTDTATVELDLTNSTPTANNGAYSATKAVAKTITLTGSDPNGDGLTFAVATPPSLGSLSCAGAGNATCTYVPTAATGTDSFTFVAVDGESATSTPGTVSFSIALPKVSVGDMSVLEPDSGTVGAFVPVSLSAPLTTDVTVRYHTVNGTAIGSKLGGTGDYQNLGTPSAPASIKLPAGTLWNAIAIQTFADATTEPDETFSVVIDSIVAADGSTISTRQATADVTIIDNYRASSDPLFNVTSQELDEGDVTRTTTSYRRAQVIMQFSKPTTADIRITYKTVDGTAVGGAEGQAGADYKAIGTSNGYITIPAGTVGLKTAEVLILGDTNPEADEDFQVIFTLPSGAPLVVRNAVSTIRLLNDD